MNSYRYVYLREQAKTQGSKGFPIAVVAMMVDRNSNTVRYGLATVHPDDRGSHYDRDQGKALAVGRLCLENNVIELPSKKFSSAHEITWMVMLALGKDNSIPSRAKKAINRWLDAANKTEFDFAVRPTTVGLNLK